MLLRSSSTPAIETLLSSVSDSPNSAHHHHFNLTSFSCNSSSPNSHSASGFIEFNPESKSLGLKAIRRAWSDGNLEGLVDSSCDMEDFRNSVAPRTSSSYQDNNSMLETAPSFSIFHSGMLDFQGSDQEPLERTITIGENIESMMGGGDFCFGKKSMGLIEEKGEEEEEGLDGIQSFRVEEQVRPASPSMYLAAGLGVQAAGFGWDAWDDELSMANIDESGNGEEYYKRMVDEYPCHPLFLRNYAQALQSKGDFHGAEDYYLRATLANPQDGESLLEYAKLVWQLHHDQDRALSYFERATQAAPEDSRVLGAYASFLWEIEDDREEGDKGDSMNELENTNSKEETKKVSPSSHIAAENGIDMLDTAEAGSRRGYNAEENYKMMIEENPNNALLLRNYAQFLCQSKGDLQGAEQYYLRAMQADPGDSEIMAQYAKLVWELHHDSEKALSYFERAVQANPEDSYVLAAYAHFLWEAEEEEDTVMQGHIQVPLVQGGTMTAVNA
ncbi:unnamed protein product [Prunus armeniaca]|uniref:TmcB/TmcC TPR repeats domain-containing protein n=1 Tax=Prunus armeniaca TaxID=36596 RepID=A0A6J5TD59_PRUAR|nr:unnamed protein product [Prunus armeniaca]